MWAIVVGIWLTCAFLGGFVGSQKNNTATGAALGFLFGPLGLLVAFSLKDRPSISVEPASVLRFQCQRCGRPLIVDKIAGKSDFMTCPHCHELTGFKTAPRQAAIQPVSRLQPCPDCGNDVSKRAKACPKCGCPIGG